VAKADDPGRSRKPVPPEHRRRQIGGERIQNSIDTFSLIRVEGASTLGIEGIITARRKIGLLRLVPLHPQPSSLTQ